MKRWTSFVNKTGVTKSELVLVLILLSGLLIGLIYRGFKPSENFEEVNYIEIYALLDSIAEAEKTSYTATDFKQNKIEALAKADTVIEKKSLYPGKKKVLPSTGELINLNTAMISDLTKLPGIGEKTAKKIIEYRKSSKFTSIDDILDVKGIGQKKFDKMKKFLTI
jgi:competence ComEA-like helix-hairpin-helix protein